MHLLYVFHFSNRIFLKNRQDYVLLSFLSKTEIVQYKMTQSSMRGYMTSHPEIKGYAGRKRFRSTALEDIVHLL